MCVLCLSVLGESLFCHFLEVSDPQTILPRVSFGMFFLAFGTSSLDSSCFLYPVSAPIPLEG